MKNCLLLGALLMGFTGVAMAQSVTVDVPSGYKVVVVPDSVSVAFHKRSASRLCRKPSMWLLRQLRLTARILMFAILPA
mgnify:CR=1 FL=1